MPTPSNYGVGAGGAIIGTQPTATETSATLDEVLTARQNLLNVSGAYETVGGPDRTAISNLVNQKYKLQREYNTNRADAQNMYGQLSTDVQTMGAGLKTAYDKIIQGSKDTAAARQGALSTELASQQKTRANIAKELGLAPESIQSNYASDTALNKAMGDVLTSAGSWENLLSSQQAGAQERTNRLATATRNTLNQTKLAMKQQLDAQRSQIDAAVAAERAKTPTQRLTSLGRVLEGIGNDLVKDYLKPSSEVTYSNNPAIAKKQQGFEYFGKNMNNTTDTNWYNSTLGQIVTKINNAKTGATPGLTSFEKEFMQVFGITGVGLGIVDPNVLRSGGISFTQ
jgi:hypothetical protein